MKAVETLFLSLANSFSDASFDWRNSLGHNSGSHKSFPVGSKKFGWDEPKAVETNPTYIALPMLHLIIGEALQMLLLFEES